MKNSRKSRIIIIIIIIIIIKYKTRHYRMGIYKEWCKNYEHEHDGDTNRNWCTWNNSERTDKGTRRLRNYRLRRDHPDYSIIKIDQNTEKSLGDMRRLAVTQTPVKDHQLTLG